MGYEYRLWKMPRKELLAEAARLNLVGFDTLPKSLTIHAILHAQGVDDEILKNPPTKGS